jgi:branched-chain amino acid transport system substrate-binding protein
LRHSKRWLLAITCGVAVVAAACGSSKSSSGTTPSTTGGATTTAGGTSTSASSSGQSSTTVGAPTTATGYSSQGGISKPCQPDPQYDSTEGKNSGQFTADIQCADQKPLKATGTPIVIGFQNLQGDPAGSFPEFTTAAQAVVKYINEELGGLGSDPSAGKAGQPIQLETCFMAVNPADSQKCANELAGKKPFLVVSSINFFGNQFPIYQAAGVNVVVATPITVGDFTAPGVFSIGPGGGCLGVHTGLVYAVTQQLKSSRVAVPWADTPPGVVCYYDLEKKPLDVLQGAVKGTSKLAGTIPDLQQIGVPIKPASPDVTPQATQVLDFKPTSIIFSAQGADCWNFVDAMTRLGWTQAKIPLVLSGACIDLQKMKQEGDTAKGIYFVGNAGPAVTNPDAITDPRFKLEAENYLTKAKQYGMPDADITKGFGIQGWQTFMAIWEQANIAAKNGTLTPDSFKQQMASTNENHIYGSVPFGCATAPAPYTAVCNSAVALTQWDGSNLNTIIDDYTAIDLVAGTELKPGP